MLYLHPLNKNDHGHYFVFEMVLGRPGVTILGAW